MKVALLTCDDLSGYITDDEILVEAFRKKFPRTVLEEVSWSAPVDWSQYTCAVVRTTWDYTKRHKDFLEVMKKIDQSGCLLLNPFSILKWNSEKTYLKDLEREDIPVIKSLFLKEESGESLKEKIISWPQDKVVLKPVVGASADQIRVLTKKDFFTELSSLTLKKDWFVQPFMNEVNQGELSFIFFGNQLSHTVIKKPKPGDFRVHEEHGGSTEIYNPNEEEMKFAKEVVDSLSEELLYARVDALQTEEGLHLIELELVEPSLYLRKKQMLQICF